MAAPADPGRNGAIAFIFVALASRGPSSCGAIALLARGAVCGVIAFIFVREGSNAFADGSRPAGFSGETFPFFSGSVGASKWRTRCGAVTS